MSAIAGTTICFEIFHNDRVIRDAPSGANWADQYHLVTTDDQGEATIHTKLRRPLMGMATLQDGAVGTAPPAVDIANAAWNDTSGYLEIPFYGDASKTYAVRIVGKHAGA